MYIYIYKYICALFVFVCVCVHVCVCDCVTGRIAWHKETSKYRDAGREAKATQNGDHRNAHRTHAEH